MAGRKFYEVMQQNFKGAFPSCRTIEKKIAKFEIPLREGEVGAEILKDYLLKNNLPLVCSIAEDATGVVGRREYSSEWNSVVGCSLPLTRSGLPDFKMSIVKHAEDIQEVFQQFERSSVVMVIMAQPLGNVPPIRICSFGTNNKFKSKDVKNRLLTVKKELNKVGITVLTYASDGDTRELKMMRELLQLGVRSTATEGSFMYLLVLQILKLAT